MATPATSKPNIERYKSLIAEHETPGGRLVICAVPVEVSDTVRMYAELHGWTCAEHSHGRTSEGLNDLVLERESFASAAAKSTVLAATIVLALIGALAAICSFLAWIIQYHTAVFLTGIVLALIGVLAKVIYTEHYGRK